MGLRNDQERARIVDAAIDFVHKHGLAAFKLRAFAAEAGTTARMVVHYFGGKGHLLGEVFSRLRAEETADEGAGHLTLADAARELWGVYSAEDRDASARRQLFFYLLGQALVEPDKFTHFLGFTTVWQQYFTEVGLREGLEPREAALRARQLNAALRGLLLEFAVTGDRESCDEAAQALITAVCAPSPQQVGV